MQKLEQYGNPSQQLLQQREYQSDRQFDDKVTRLIYGGADSVITDNSSVTTSSMIDGQLGDIITHQTWAQRTFGPMNPGSLRGTVLLLMAGALGSGLLALPSNAKEVGIILAVIFVFLAGSLSLASMKILIECSEKINVTTYSALMMGTMGNVWKQILELSIALFSWGCTLGYEISFAMFMVNNLAQLGVDGLFIDQDKGMYVDYTSQGNTIRILTIGAYGILNIPFVLMRNMSSLRYLSSFSTLAISYIMITIVIYFFINLPNAQWSEIKYFDFNIMILPCFASTVYCYVNHQFILPLKKELKRPTINRMFKIFNRAVFVESILYSMVLVFGYLTQFNNTQSMVVNGYASNNYAMIIGKFALMIALFFATPLNVNPTREVMYELTQNKSTYMHFVLSLSILFTGCGMAMLVPNAKVAFGVIGGFAGTSIAFTFPGIIYLKMSKDPLSSTRNIIVAIITSIVTFMGYGGAVYSII